MTYLRADLFIAQALELAREAVAGVVDNNIDAAEVRESFGESGVDGGLFGHVAVDSEEIIFGGGGEGEGGGVAGGGDHFVAFFEALLDVMIAEAGGGARDELSKTQVSYTIAIHEHNLAASARAQ